MRKKYAIFFIFLSCVYLTHFLVLADEVFEIRNDKVDKYQEGDPPHEKVVKIEKSTVLLICKSRGQSDALFNRITAMTRNHLGTTDDLIGDLCLISDQPQNIARQMISNSNLNSTLIIEERTGYFYVKSKFEDIPLFLEKEDRCVKIAPPSSLDNLKAIAEMYQKQQEDFFNQISLDYKDDHSKRNPSKTPQKVDNTIASYYQQVQFIGDDFNPMSLSLSHVYSLTKKEVVNHENKLNEITDFWNKKTEKNDGLYEDRDFATLYKESPDIEIDDFIKRSSHQDQTGDAQKIWVVGDVHGDLNAFLFPLISSGMASIDLKRPFLLLNPETGETLSLEGENQAMVEKVDGLIKIPNLIINEKEGNLQEKMIFLGDLIDRGEFSVEVFYLMVNLIQKQKEMGKSSDQFPINFIMGNHELMMLLHDFRYFEAYKGPNPNRNSRFYPFKISPQLMAKQIATLLIQGDLKVAIEEQDIFFSHSYPSEALLQRLGLEEKNINAEKLATFVNEMVKKELSEAKKNHIRFSSDQFFDIVNSRLPVFRNIDGLLWIRSEHKDLAENDNKKASFLPLSTIRTVSGHQGLQSPENYGKVPLNLTLDTSQSGAYRVEEENRGRPEFFFFDFKRRELEQPFQIFQRDLSDETRKKDAVSPLSPSNPYYNYNYK